MRVGARQERCEQGCEAWDWVAIRETREGTRLIRTRRRLRRYIKRWWWCGMCMYMCVRVCVCLSLEPEEEDADKDNDKGSGSSIRSRDASQPASNASASRGKKMYSTEAERGWESILEHQ